MPATRVTKMTYHKGDSSSRCQGLEVSHMLACLLRPSTCTSVHIVKLHTRYLSKARRSQHLAMKTEKNLTPEIICRQTISKALIRREKETFVAISN